MKWLLVFVEHATLLLPSDSFHLTKGMSLLFPSASGYEGKHVHASPDMLPFQQSGSFMYQPEISLLPVLCLLKERPQVNDRNTCFLGHIFASLCIELCNFIGALWKLFCFITICRPVISLNHQTWTTKYLSHRKHGSRLSLTWQIHSVPPHQLEEV